MARKPVNDFSDLWKQLNDRKPAPLNGPFNDWIAAAMDAQGIKSVEEFSRKSGINRQVLHSLIRGRVSPKGTQVKPSIDTLVLLARALGRPIQDLIFRLEPNAPGADLPVPSMTKGFAVPIVGAVGAGPGQNSPIENGVMYVPNRVAKGRDLAGYHVVGDSMAGGKRPIYGGDFVAVNKLDKGGSGSLVVARLTDGSWVCKALKDDKFGKRLMSLNPLYTNSNPPLIPASDITEIIGKVVWVQGEVGSQED